MSNEPQPQPDHRNESLRPAQPGEVAQCHRVADRRNRMGWFCGRIRIHFAPERVQHYFPVGAKASRTSSHTKSLPERHFMISRSVKKFPKVNRDLSATGLPYREVRPQPQLYDRGRTKLIQGRPFRKPDSRPTPANKSARPTKKNRPRLFAGACSADSRDRTAVRIFTTVPFALIPSCRPGVGTAGRRRRCHRGALPSPWALPCCRCCCCRLPSPSWLPSRGWL